MFTQDKPPIDELMHYGVKRRSGRYPWGSGENPYQHSGDFYARVQELKKSGLSEKEIVKELGFESSTDYRHAYTIAKNERRQLLVAGAKALQEDGLGPSEIGRKLAERYGMDKPISESTIRSYLNPDSEKNMNKAAKTADILKKEIEAKGMIDIGSNVELELGVTRTKLDDALAILEYEGYNIVGVSVPQANNPKHRTTVKVLCPPGDPKEQQRQLYQDSSLIKSVGEYHSRDGGDNWDKREYPSSISSDRVAVRYGDQGGSEMDGVIQIRPGVKDLSLGNSHYAQVRIMVDGTHYLKGMAIYSDDIPEGVDIVFNTNKKSGTPKLDVMKPIKDDPDMPFGAYIKRGGQSFYPDPKGKYKDPITGEPVSLSAINKLKEEGDWDKSSRNLSSQFLSKQPQELIKRQLQLSYSDKRAEFEDICNISNETVRKKMLKEFVDSCDSAVVHMKAAALPRQETRVILPVTQLKETEVYAPYLKNGEKVCLVRYPHAGTFEIPELTVNNKNPSAKSILGNATDAIGINAKVAARLSGADFDGDTVIVIPVNSRVRVKTTRPLDGLANFDPKEAYSTEGKKNVRLMPEDMKQKQMGVVSNLITDMTLQGAPESDIVKAVRHSMVVIDAVKHKLDYKQSEIDNDISTLKKKYQIQYDEQGNIVGTGGASTLISRHKQTVRVPERKGGAIIDKETGEISYRESGRKYRNKKGELVDATTEVKLLNITPDLHILSSGTPQEEMYAEYGNSLKALANEARKFYISTKGIKKSPSAAKIYSEEVASLDRKLTKARKNVPRERQAQAIANSIIKAKIQANPELKEHAYKDELSKIQRHAIAEARASVGASGKDTRVDITDDEWKAIQAGAISHTKLDQILRFADEDRIKELALPKATTQLSTFKVSKLKSMKASGYTIAEIAESLGVSTSTVSKYLNS